jgi:hypothetical protein
MTYYIKQTVKFFGSGPFTTVVNDYSCKEVVEKALKAFQKRKPSNNVEQIKFFITTEY